MDVSLTLRLIFEDADRQHPDPARVTLAADAGVAELRKAGYTVRPAYTGAMGGEVYEVLQRLADGAAANKEVVVALIAGIAAPIAGALAERLKRPASAPVAPPPAQVTVVVAGTVIPVEGRAVDDAELLRRLLEADPALAERVTLENVEIRVQTQRRS